ncbi:MAG: fibronectin type III domain-containing protein [Candidatus Saganbacteria bacterium]|nr:fibronectin type III domain-containing protein [Candidatus Saganbacteria bacterium]
MIKLKMGWGELKKKKGKLAGITLGLFLVCAFALPAFAVQDWVYVRYSNNNMPASNEVQFTGYIPNYITFSGEEDGAIWTEDSYNNSVPNPDQGWFSAANFGITRTESDQMKMPALSKQPTSSDPYKVWINSSKNSTFKEANNITGTVGTTSPNKLNTLAAPLALSSAKYLPGPEQCWAIPGDQKAFVGWKKVPQLTQEATPKYKVYRRPYTDTTGAIINNNYVYKLISVITDPNTTSYVDTDHLANGTAYAYLVIACSGSGATEKRSGHPDESSATPSAGGPVITSVLPNPALGGTVVTIAGSNLGTNSGQPTKETIFIYNSSGTYGITAEVISWNATQITFTLPSYVAPGTYQIAVMSNSKISNSLTFNASIVAPNNVMVSGVNNIGPNWAVVTWEAVSGNDHGLGITYEVQYSTNEADANAWKPVTPATTIETVYSLQGLAPLTGYYVRVRAKYQGTNTAWTSGLTLASPYDFKTTLGYPKHVIVNGTQNIGGEWAIVTWEGTSDNDKAYGISYEVQYCLDNATWIPSVNGVTTGETLYRLKDLEPLKKYYVRIRAKKGTTKNPTWTTAEVLAPPASFQTVLPKPKNVMVSGVQNIGGSWAVVTWEGSSTKDKVFGISYQVQVNTSNTFPSPIIYSTTESVFTLQGLAPATGYYVHVRATKEGTSTAWENGQILSTPYHFMTILPAPKKVMVSGDSNIGPTWAVVTWEASSGNDKAYNITYDLQYSINNTDWLPITPAPTAETVYSLTGLVPGSGYYLRVRAKKTGVTPTNWTAGEVLATPYDFRTDLLVPTVFDINMKSAMVSWEAVQGASGYEVKVYANDGVTLITTVPTSGVDSISGKPFTWLKIPSVLSANTTYKAEVSASLSGINTVVSEKASFTTLNAPLAPKGLTIFDINMKSAMVSWEAAEGADNYLVTIYENDGVTLKTTVTTSGADGTGKPFTWLKIPSVLSANTTYKAVVTAKVGGVSGGTSTPQVSFTTRSTPLAPKNLTIFDINMKSAMAGKLGSSRGSG